MRDMKYPKKHPWAHPWKATKRRRKPATKVLSAGTIPGKLRGVHKPKTRRVFVTLELESAAPLSRLKRPLTWIGQDWAVLQVDANVSRRSK